MARHFSVILRHDNEWILTTENFGIRKKTELQK